MASWFMFLLIGLITGVGAGILLSRLEMLKSKKQQQLEDQLEQTRNELDDYRTQVARHFVQTSGLINNMTESYRAVFDHLSGGARELCGDRLATHLLDLPKTRMLEQEERERAEADVQMTDEAISDIEDTAPELVTESSAELAAEPDTTLEPKDVTTVEATAKVQKNTDTSAHQAPTGTRKASPGKSKKRRKAESKAKVEASTDTDDDEHAAFAGEQGVPPEVASAGKDEAPRPNEPPTVH